MKLVTATNNWNSEILHNSNEVSTLENCHASRYSLKALFINFKHLPQICQPDYWPSHKIILKGICGLAAFASITSATCLSVCWSDISINISLCEIE